MATRLQNPIPSTARLFIGLACPILALLSFNGCMSPLAMNDDFAGGCPPSGCLAESSVEARSGGNDAGTSAQDSAPPRNLLCGVGVCNPDDLESKVCFSKYEPADAAADSPIMLDSSPTDSASDRTHDVNTSPFDASVIDAFGGSKHDRIYPYLPPSIDSGVNSISSTACRVSWLPNDTPTAACAPAGTGVQSEPCSTSADCAPGFACVGSQAIGQCLQYCCLGSLSCPSNTYCAEQPARDYPASHPSVSPSDVRQVPVCVLSRECDPLDSSNDPNPCDEGLSCVIMRSDGTTGCSKLPADAGHEGDSCKDIPCAAGYVCSKTTDTCLRLCHATSSNQKDECSGGICQGGVVELAEGHSGVLGICVGAHGN